MAAEATTMAAATEDGGMEQAAHAALASQREQKQAAAGASRAPVGREKTRNKSEATRATAKIMAATRRQTKLNTKLGSADGSGLFRQSPASC